MKIIEALKELPVLNKRISKNIEKIQQYSSDIDLNKPWDQQDLPFKTPEEQQKEVDGLIQSTNDLVKRRTQLRRALAITNTKVEVTIMGETNTISEWIDLREGGMDLRIKAYGALNDNHGLGKMRSIQFDPETGVRVKRFFDVKQRDEEVARLMLMKEGIDAQLEVINATTDLAVEVA